MSLLKYFKKKAIATEAVEEDVELNEMNQESECREDAAPAPTASKSSEEGEGESEEECVELEKRGRKRAQMSSGSNPKKRRKWNSDYIRFGFYLHQDESRNPFPSGKCFFVGLRS